MSKRILYTITATAVGLSIASIAWAAVSTKYFQKIKQNTYIGNIQIVTTAGAESQKEMSRSDDLVGWTSGSLASTASTCRSLIGEGQDATAITAGYISTNYYRDYTIKQVGGIPGINTNVDPPIFYSKVLYYKNGKLTSLPEFTTKKYLIKTVNARVYCDGHASSEEVTPSASTIPNAGTLKYTYKLITLQPSN
jgi:hypothetical protein